MIKSIKALVIKYAKKNVTFRKITRFLSVNLSKFLYLKYYLFNKIDDKLILFESFRVTKQQQI